MLASYLMYHISYGLKNIKHACTQTYILRTEQIRTRQQNKKNPTTQHYRIRRNYCAIKRNMFLCVRVGRCCCLRWLSVLRSEHPFNLYLCAFQHRKVKKNRETHINLTSVERMIGALPVARSLRMFRTSNHVMRV